MPDARKTTKDILKEKIGQNKGKSLFDQGALNDIKKDFEGWKSNTVKENDRNNWLVTPQTILGSQMPRELIYVGNSMPEQIVKAAVQEDADVIGVSSLGGAHLQLGRELISEAEKEGIKDNKAYVIGGAIPPEDAIKLKEMGFDAIFASGATKEEIISSINNIVEKKFKIFGGQIER